MSRAPHLSSEPVLGLRQIAFQAIKLMLKAAPGRVILNPHFAKFVVLKTDALYN